MRGRYIVRKRNRIGTRNGSRGRSRGTISGAEGVRGWWGRTRGYLGNPGRFMIVLSVVGILVLGVGVLILGLRIVLITIDIGDLRGTRTLVGHVAWLPALETSAGSGEVVSLLRRQPCVLPCRLHLDRGLEPRGPTAWCRGGRGTSRLRNRGVTKSPLFPNLFLQFSSATLGISKTFPKELSRI